MNQDPNSFFILFQGDSCTQQFQVTENGQPVDISLADEIELCFQQINGAVPAFFDALLTLGKVTIVNGPLGIGALNLLGGPSGDTINFAEITRANLDVIVTIGATIKTYRINNGLTVKLRNCQ